MVNRSMYKATPSSQVFDLQHVILFVFSVLSLALVLGSCSKDTCDAEQTYIEYQAVYQGLDEIRQPIKTEAPRQRESTGKILFYKDYILINEPHIGIHVFDNSNPSTPVATAFYDIPGNIDMEIEGDMLIADHYMDIVQLDISDINAPKTVFRIENAIKDVYDLHEEVGIVVDWEPKLVTRKGSCDTLFQDVYHHMYIEWCGIGPPLGITSIYYPNPGQPEYINKSIHFTLGNGHLFLVEKNQLRTYTFGNEMKEKSVLDLELNYEYSPTGELLNVREDFLFVGSHNGQFVYDISNPDAPTSVSQIEGFSYCNKLLFDEGKAYVANNVNGICFTEESKLDVITFENAPNPIIERTFLMVNPTGIACTENELFVADNGIKIFDKTNPIDLEFIDTYFTTFQISNIYKVPNTEVLLADTPNFIVQFDISNPRNIEEISRIEK